MIKIVIDEIPSTINKYIGRTNFREYQRDKKRYQKLIQMETIGINPMYKKCRIKVVYYFKDKRKHDPSNYDKFLLDGLVEAHIIEDDNYNVITEFTTIGDIDYDRPRVEIEIYDEEN